VEPAPSQSSHRDGAVRPALEETGGCARGADESARRSADERSRRPPGGGGAAQVSHPGHVTPAPVDESARTLTYRTRRTCMTLCRRVILAALFASAATAVCCAPRAFASGVALYPGTDAAGMAGAFRGVADDWSAAFWNPAGLVDVEGSQVAVTGTFVLPTLNVTPLPYNGYANTIVYQNRSS